MTSAVHDTAIREHLVEAFKAHVQRTHEVWTLGGDEAGERFAASLLELVNAWEPVLSPTMCADRIEEAAAILWTCFTELACRADVAPEGPAPPGSGEELALALLAFEDAEHVARLGARLRDGALVANELAQDANVCAAAASALDAIAMRRR